MINGQVPDVPPLTPEQLRIWGSLAAQLLIQAFRAQAEAADQTLLYQRALANHEVKQALSAARKRVEKKKG